MTRTRLILLIQIPCRSILSKVVPSLAGPKRPQDRIELPDVKQNFVSSLSGSQKSARTAVNGHKETIHDGAVVIAAITSCTNTSNPSVMVAAGLTGQEGGGTGVLLQSRG